MSCIKMRRLLFGFVFLLQLASLPVYATEVPKALAAPNKPVKLTQDQKKKLEVILLNAMARLSEQTTDPEYFDSILLQGLASNDRKEMRALLKEVGDLPEVQSDGHKLTIVSGKQTLTVRWPNLFAESNHVEVSGVDWIYDPRRPMKWQIGLLQRKIEYSRKHAQQVGRFKSMVLPEAGAEIVEETMELAAKAASTSEGKALIRVIMEAVGSTRAVSAAAVENGAAVTAAAKTEEAVGKAVSGKLGTFQTVLGASLIGAAVGPGVSPLIVNSRNSVCEWALDTDFTVPIIGWEPTDPDGHLMTVICKDIEPKDDDSPALDTMENMISKSMSSANILAMFEQHVRSCPKTDATGQYEALIRRNQLKDGKWVQSSDPWSKITAKFDNTGHPTEVLVYRQSKPENPDSPFDIISEKFLFGAKKPRMSGVLVENEKPSSNPLVNDKYVELKKRSKSMTPSQIQAYKSGVDLITFLRSALTQCAITEVKKSTDKGEAPTAPEGKQKTDGVVP
jgi:hypothetical protein